MNEFTTDELKQWEEHGKRFSPEEIRAIEAAWTALYAEAPAKRDLDPASPEAQALLDRHDALLERTFAGNRELLQLTQRKYEAGAFQHVPEAPQKEDFAFWDRIRQARGA